MRYFRNKRSALFWILSYLINFNDTFLACYEHITGQYLKWEAMKHVALDILLIASKAVKHLGIMFWTNAQDMIKLQEHSFSVQTQCPHPLMKPEHMY